MLSALPLYTLQRQPKMLHFRVEVMKRRELKDTIVSERNQHYSQTGGKPKVYPFGDNYPSPNAKVTVTSQHYCDY